MNQDIRRLISCMEIGQRERKKRTNRNIPLTVKLIFHLLFLYTPNKMNRTTNLEETATVE